MAPGTSASHRFFHSIVQAVCGHKLVIRHLLEFCCRPTRVVHSVVQSSLVSWLLFCTLLLPRPPHTDIDTQVSRVSVLCRSGSCSVPWGPMNATIQQLVFLIIILADADGLINCTTLGSYVCKVPSSFTFSPLQDGQGYAEDFLSPHVPWIVVFSCLTHSSGEWYIFGWGTIPLSCTYCILLSILKSLQYASWACAHIRVVVIVQQLWAGSCTLFLIWKPRMFVSVWKGMSIIRNHVSHGMIASALGFPMFTFAPDASSKQCRASCILRMSVGDVTKIVTSSV